MLSHSSIKKNGSYTSRLSILYRGNTKIRVFRGDIKKQWSGKRNILKREEKSSPQWLNYSLYFFTHSFLHDFLVYLAIICIPLFFLFPLQRARKWQKDNLNSCLFYFLRFFFLHSSFHETTLYRKNKREEYLNERGYLGNVPSR